MKKLLTLDNVFLAIIFAALGALAVRDARAQVPVNCTSAALAYTAATHSYTCNNAPNFTTSVTSPITVITADTWANVSAGGTSGQIRRVSNIGRGSFGSLWCYGTRWAPCGGTLMLASLGNAITGITNAAETIVLQTLIPAGAWQTNDTIRLWSVFTKSGTTDTGTIKIRVGTSGTTADTAVLTYTCPATANVGCLIIKDYKLVNSTTVTPIAPFSTGYTAQSPTPSTPITISSAASNDLYVTLTMQSSGASDTVGLFSGQIELVTP